VVRSELCADGDRRCKRRCGLVGACMRLA